MNTLCLSLALWNRIEYILPPQWAWLAPDLYKQFNVHALYNCRNKLSLCYILGSQMLKIRFKWFINYSMAVVLSTCFLPYRNQCTTIPCRHVLYPMFISCPVHRFTYNLYVCVFLLHKTRDGSILGLCVCWSGVWLTGTHTCIT